MFTMRDVSKQSTGGPQIAHKLSKGSSTLSVDKLFVSFMLLTCNDLS